MFSVRQIADFVIIPKTRKATKNHHVRRSSFLPSSSSMLQTAQLALESGATTLALLAAHLPAAFVPHIQSSS